MALKTGTVGTEAPYLAYILDAVQIGGTGNQRTIKVTVQFKVDGSANWYYGYPCSWRAIVNGSYGSYESIKGTETWNGGQSYRTFTQTLTVDVGTTSSKTISVGFQTYNSTYGYWNGSATANFTVSATNVAPTLSGTVTTNVSSIFPENTTSITVTSPAASDTNLSGYVFSVSINGGGYTQLSSQSGRTYTHNISGYGQGTTFKYRVYAYDTAGLTSGYVYSDTFTKNTFTGDVLSSSSSISYSTSSISFNYSGAKNTNGNTTFTRTISSSDITVYNGNISSSPITITIYKSGTVPSGAYIKFDDIKNKFKNNSYKGSISFTLTVKNAYGSVRESSKSINVNIQTTPNAVSSCSISTDASKSTAYKTVSSTNNKYFIPDSDRVVRVEWSGGSGKLGETISYEVWASYNGGSFSKVADVASGNTYYNHSIPKQTSSQTLVYKIRVKTSYGTYADKDTSSVTLHYYNEPSLTVGTITRTATDAAVILTIKTNSSIPNINTVGTWNCYNKGTTTSVSSGTLTQSQSAQTITATELTDTGQYDLKVTYKDDTGFSSDVVYTISIGQNAPILFINKYGAGIGGVKANTTYALNVKGNTQLNGNRLSIKGTQAEGYQGVISFDIDAAQGVQLRYNSYDATRAPFGLHIEKTPENTQTTNKAYLDVEGSIYSGASINATGNISSSGNISVSGQITSNGNITSSGTINGQSLNISKAGDPAAVLKNSSGGDITLTFDRNTSVNWRLLVSGGVLKFQNDWSNGAKSSFFDAVTFTHDTGDVWIKGDISANGNITTSSKLNGKSMELRANGGTPYIDFSNDNSVDYDARLILTQDGILDLQGSAFRANGGIYVRNHLVFDQANTEQHLRFSDCGSANKTVYFYKGSSTSPTTIGLWDATRNAAVWRYYDTNEFYIETPYVRVSGHLIANGDNQYYLGTTSPAGRWKQLCAASSTINTSDSRMKEEITPVLDNKKELEFLKEIAEVEPELVDTTSAIETVNGMFEVNNPIIKETMATAEDCYEFVRDRLRYYAYSYKIDDTTEDEAMSKEDKKRMAKSLGFVADEYDLQNDVVAKEFLFRTDDNILNYNTGNYTAILGLALQRALRKIDDQQIIIDKLNERISKIENLENE